LNGEVGNATPCDEKAGLRKTAEGVAMSASPRRDAEASIGQRAAFIFIDVDRGASADGKAFSN
jgi:hypothetical protein